MSDSNLAVTILREKEREYAVTLSDIRRAIDILLHSDTPKEVQTQRISRVSPTTKKEKTTRTYNTSNRISGIDAIDPIADKIRAQGKFLHKVQIEELLNNSVNVSPILSIAKSKGKREITNYKPGLSQNQIVWGFTEWLDANGKPKPEYMYDEEFVMSRK